MPTMTMGKIQRSFIPAMNITQSTAAPISAV